MVNRDIEKLATWLAEKYRSSLKNAIGVLKELGIPHQQILVASMDHVTVRSAKTPSYNPRFWPEELPLPLTVDQAHDIVDAWVDPLAKLEAENIVSLFSILAAPESQKFLATRHGRLLVNRWPYPQSCLLDNSAKKLTLLDAAKNILFLMVAYSSEKRQPQKTQKRREWPSDVTYLEVAIWAQQALNKVTGEKRFGDFLLNQVQNDQTISDLSWNDKDGREINLQPYSLALLYQLDRATRLRQPKRLTMGLIAVDKPPVRTMISLGGADPAKLEPGADIYSDDPSLPTSLEFRWQDGEQLELNFLPPGAGPLVAVAHKYGDIAVRHLLGLYVFSWAARAFAKQPFWWWPDEHLWLSALTQNKENRRMLRNWLTNMTQCSLAARYHSGKPLVGPIVTVSLTDGDAYHIHLHPALYQGVTSEEGRLGRHWWPLPVELLRLKADGKVHILAPVLGYMWRGAMSKRGNSDSELIAKVRTQRLAEYLAVRKRKYRKSDTQAANILRRSLIAAQSCDFIGRWEVVDGELERLTGNVVATPGQAAMRVLQGGQVERAAWLPATGDELNRWLEQTDTSSGEASQQFGINDSTLRRLTKTHINRPLPAKVRAGIRDYLWGSF